MNIYAKRLAAALLAGLTTCALASGDKPSASASPAGDPPTQEQADLYSFPKAGEARVIDDAEVERLLKTHGSELLIVNFWATWCGPCIEELPAFVQLSKEYDPKRARVVGFSVDLKRDVETKVVPFLKKREIPYANVVLFVDQETLIPRISQDWGGQVPATFLFDKSGKKRGQILGATDHAALKALVDKALAEIDAEKSQK